MNKKTFKRYLNSNREELEFEFNNIKNKKKYQSYSELIILLLEKLNFFNQNRNHEVNTRNAYNELIDMTSREEENLINKILMETVIGDDTFYFIQRVIKASDFKKDRLVRYHISNEDIMQIKLGLESCLTLEEKIQFCLVKEEEYRNKALKFETSFQLNGGENEARKYAEYCANLVNINKKQLEIENGKVNKDNKPEGFIHHHVSNDIIKVLRVFVKKESQHDDLQDLIVTGTMNSEDPIYVNCNILNLVSCFEPLLRYNLIIDSEFFDLPEIDKRKKCASWICYNFTVDKHGKRILIEETVDKYLKQINTKYINSKLLYIDCHRNGDKNSYHVISDHLD